MFIVVVVVFVLGGCNLVDSLHVAAKSMQPGGRRKGSASNKVTRSGTALYQAANRLKVKVDTDGWTKQTK